MIARDVRAAARRRRLLGLAAVLAVACARGTDDGAAPRADSPVASTPAPVPAPLTRRAAVEAPHGMVVSASAIASQAGRDVLAAGGNAVDAAVATGLALAVTYPVAGNIGGGGFMVIRMPDGRATTIDFREVAPQAATPEMFLDSTGAYSARVHHDGHRAE